MSRLSWPEDLGPEEIPLIAGADPDKASIADISVSTSGGKNDALGSSDVACKRCEAPQ